MNPLKAFTAAAAFLALSSAAFAQQNVNYDEAAVAPYELPDPLVFDKLFVRIEPHQSDNNSSGQQDQQDKEGDFPKPGFIRDPYRYISDPGQRHSAKN